MQRFSFLIIFFILGFLIACNQTKDDFIPKNENQNGEQSLKIVTTKDAPVVINLLKEHQINEESTFEITKQPLIGTANFLENGLILYRPDSNTSSGNAVITYEICVNGTCESFTIIIEIVDSTDDIPCTHSSILTDFATVSTPHESLFIDVLANDSFCENEVDTTRLAIVVPPESGTASVGLNQIYYTAGAELPPVDYIVYSVTEEGNPENVAYGLVIINKICGQQIKIHNDFSAVPSDVTSNIDVLWNDVFCPDSIDLNTLTIIELPENGTAGINSDKDIVYTPDMGFVGEDSLKYQLTDISGDTHVGKLHIEVFDGGLDACDIEAIQAVPDNYTMSLAGLVDGESFLLNILDNDRICESETWTLNLLGSVHLGMVEIDSNVLTYFPDVDNILAGDISFFTYQICDNTGYCSEAIVQILFTP